MASLSDFVHLTGIQKKTLMCLSDESVFYEHFYFTGGTALKALGIVPRESNDLDFFTFSDFDSARFPSVLADVKKTLGDLLGQDRLALTDKGFLDTETSMTIDFILDHIPAISEFFSFDWLKVAGLEDIAASKASAICCRDEVKDFIDLAFLTRSKGWTLADLADMAEKKYRIGTVTEEKLLEELLSKREMFTIRPEMFLVDGDDQVRLVDTQIDKLLNSTGL